MKNAEAREYSARMKWEFGGYALDEERAELLGPDGPVALEKQPKEILFLLARNTHRVVSKEEICSAVWQGRFISDATISTAIKMARRATGDDGKTQSVIRTVHGRGFRFVADLKTSGRNAAQARPQTTQSAAPVGTSKPSVAVLRFLNIGNTGDAIAIADAVPAELISSLSRLRWAHVIARGSSFRFSPDQIDPSEIGQALGARYLLSGSVECIGEVLTVSTELLLAETGELVWSDRFACSRQEFPLLRNEIVTAVVGAMELELPHFEAEAAQRLEPDQFDAWSHYHLGLRHMYRFNQTDNQIAAHHFDRAALLDPKMSRAFAGKSQTEWQQAFMLYGTNRKDPLKLALAAAEHALELDPRDPFANFSMGRVRWLEGDAATGLSSLARALSINPNYAQCRYASGMVQLLTGEAEQARASVRHAVALSPLDPLLFAMLGVDAMSHFATGEYQEAAKIADQASKSPGSHFYIPWIAAVAYELSGQRQKAETQLKLVRLQRPRLSQSIFFGAFPFSDNSTKALMSEAMTRLGID